MRTLDRTAKGLKELYPDAFWLVHAAKDPDAEKAFLLKPNVVIIEEQPFLPERREYAWQIGRGCHGIQSVLKQLWSLQRAWKVYEKTGFVADCVVRLRADLIFEKAPERPKNDAIYIPKFCNFFGYNDRFAFGGYDDMKKYFTRLEQLDEYINNKGIFHPETFLAHVLQDVHVKRTDAIFHTLRGDGTLDKAISKKEWNDIV
jgi:hypothetical protein